MDVWPRVQQEKYKGYEYVFVNSSNKVISSFNVAPATKAVTGRELTYMKRADLARILYEHAKENIDYIFGDSINKLTENNEGVKVDFESGTSRNFDLVIGADGVHSKVRSLVFGEESEYKKYMGYYVAAFTIHSYPSEYGKVHFYTMPGKSVTLYNLKEGGVIAVFTFRQTEELIYDIHNTKKQKQLLFEAFANESWDVPKLLEAMKSVDDLFFDIVAQIRMDTWAKGRVILVGDAGYCPTLLTGYGSQLALVGAYILAGELKIANGDYKTAYEAYQRELRPFVEQKQKNIKLLRQVVPGSDFTLWIRNQVMKLMSIPFVLRFVFKRTYGKVVREETIKLKDY